MCGIAGYIGRQPPEEITIRETLELMNRRGPDNQSFVSFRAGDLSIVLLHSRLSIIDLDPRSNQPFTIGDYTVIFNGEIYNYLELRAELKKEGIAFRTDSDTEVLLRYYMRYGQDCVQHFEGMWSFAVYNGRDNTLFLSRDRFAEKPLYYMDKGEGICFGSEIKYIKSLSHTRPALNERQVLRYLVNGYKSLYKHGETFFRDVQELPYASSMVISSSLQTKVSRYWHPEFNEQRMSCDEAIEGARYYFMESMKLRLRADVPLAFCLSGGVDSSAIASVAAKKFNYDVSTFSIIDADERYNENENIDATIKDLGCTHTKIHLSHTDTLERLKRLIAYHDAPVATISYLIHSMLSEKIADHGYRVACSGTAADELFTGYYDHYNLHLYEMRNHPGYKQYLEDWTGHVKPVVRNPYLKNPELFFGNRQFRDHIYLNNDLFAECLSVDFNEPFTEANFCDSLLKNRMLNELFHESIPVILHEDDLNSMFYSIENRSPYLDSRLFTFAYSIPAEYLIVNGYNKFILRQSMEGILNDKVRLDRKKIGFNASLRSVLDFSDKNNRAYLLDGNGDVPVIAPDKIAPLLDMNPLPNSYSKFLFNVINIKIFYELNA